MAEQRWLADVKVGVFVLVALAVLVIGSLWVAGSTLIAGPRVSYRVRMQDSAGVQAGDRVRLAGVPVGRIRNVTLQPEEEWPVVLEVGIRPGVTLRADSTARISSAGLLGSPFLQLVQGSAGAPRLQPGGEIRGESGGGLGDALARIDELSGRLIGLVDRAGGVVEQVSNQIGPIMSNLELLLSEQNAEDIRRLLGSLGETLPEAAGKISPLLERLEEISRQVEGGVEGLPELTAKLEGLVDDARSALGPDGSRLAGVLDAARGGMSSADEALSVLGDNRGELEDTLRDLRDTVANLKAFSQLVKERPFSLVRIKAEPERRPGQGVD